MSTHKKILISVLILIAILFTITCSKNSSSSSASPSGPNPTPVITPVPTAGYPYSDLVPASGGAFTQSDTSGNSFSSTVSAFKIGKYQVTYDLWYKVRLWTVANGYTFAYSGHEGNTGAEGAVTTTAKYLPVTYISWRDAVVWCNAYSQMTGLTPVYCTDSGYATPIKTSIDASYGSSVDTANGSIDNPYVNWNANGYRLPTESEYQYAASYIDGTNWTPYNYASGAEDIYSDIAATSLVAWFYSDCSDMQAVGLLNANKLGIYDMSGNVQEWCWDWFGTYPTTAQTDYRGPASGSARALRGGSYTDYAAAMEVGIRISNGPYNSGNLLLGFRVARTY